MTESDKYNRKKFLYLDKFTEHYEKDQSWKKTASELLNKLADQGETLTWTSIAAITISILALLVAFYK